MQYFINSGHWNNDPGVVVKGVIERDLCFKVRDELQKLLPRGIYVPDDLDLKQSISYVNGRLVDRAIAIDIHFNANNDSSKRGIEVYYSSNKHLAEVLSKNIANRMKMPNGGAVHDSRTHVGSLGWCRKVECPSVVIECGYLTNQWDRKMVTGKDAPKKIAQAIYEALIFTDDDRLREEITVLRQQVEIFKNFITNYLK